MNYQFIIWCFLIWHVYICNIIDFLIPSLCRKILIICISTLDNLVKTWSWENNITSFNNGHNFHSTNRSASNWPGNQFGMTVARVFFFFYKLNTSVNKTTLIHTNVNSAVIGHAIGNLLLQKVKKNTHTLVTAESIKTNVAMNFRLLFC